jgi:hypothetical protein
MGTRSYTLGQMPLPFGLHTQDVVGPIVSGGAAAVSVFFAWWNAQMAKRNANRSIYVDGQKFLIEVCKLLVADPVLWCLYDDDLLRNEESVYHPNDPLQHAKLRAFAHLHLNMFEIIVNEVPKRAIWKRNASSVWYDYLNDTLTRSRMIRDILDEPASKIIWSDALNKVYERWKEKKAREENNCGDSTG